MFGGKSTTLIHRIHMAGLAGTSFRAFKPVIDTRSGDSFIHAHGGEKIEAEFIDRDTPNLPKDVGLIAIDEAQFLTSDAVPRILDVVRDGVRVIAAGLDLDAFGRPFGPMPILMAFANEVVKLAGTCARCRQPSTRSHRLVCSSSAILVGGAEVYEPRCLRCFDPREGE